MADWFRRRLESLLDNCIFAAGVAVLIAVWNAIHALSMPWIVGISGGIFILILILIRIIVFGMKHSSANRRLCDIPAIISGMHERLTSLVEQMPPLTKTEVETFLEDYLGLFDLDESRYPELKQITPMSDVKTDREVMGVVLDRFLSTFTEMDDVKLVFIRVGGLMNVKGTGIGQVGDADGQYTRLKGRLAKVQPEILPELNTAVDNYLQFSFGWLSLSRLISSIPYGEITNALPPKYSAELGIWKERMDTMMKELLAEVRSIIQRPIYETANSPSTSHKEGS